MAADVDADDTNGTALATADTDVVKQNDNLSSLTLPENDVVLGDGEGSFTELANEIQGKTEVQLGKNYKYVDADSAFKGGITLSGTVTIDGGGSVKIDASHQARIFNIAENAHVTLKGITFINGYATGNGGAINSLGVLNVENCKFINNTANFNGDDDPGHGGAIYLDHSTSSDIKDSEFTGNIAA